MKALYTEKQIGISAVIGGPVPAGILFYLNYKNIDKTKEAYITLAATLIFTAALSFTIIKLPSDILDKVPNAVFTAVYGLLVYLFYNRFLAKEVRTRFEAGHPKAGNWGVVAAIVVGLIINLAIIFGFAVNEPPFAGNKMSFGKSEIYFNEKTTKDDVNKLAEVLKSNGIFSDENSMAIRLETWETRYVVIFQIDKQYWSDQATMYELTNLKTRLSEVFKKDVSITLEHYELSGKKQEKII